MRNNDLTTLVNTTVDTFVRNITTLAGQAAKRLVENAFGAVTPAARTRSSEPHSKRTAKDLDVLCDKFASFVAANPGLRIEQINKKLGTQTKDLALPIRKLLASGRVKSKGQKRSTTYFPGKK